MTITGLRVEIRNERRSEGDHSLYVVSRQGGWYAGVTFSSLARAKRVAAVMTRALEEEGKLAMPHG